MARNAEAVLIASPQDGRPLTAGEFYFIYREAEPDPCGIVHACPCGCGGKSALFFRGRGGGSQEWDVAGEWPKVTLSPSIGIRHSQVGEAKADGYHWHGWLRNGVFEEG